MNAVGTEILQLTGIGKQFPGVRALDGVSISIRAGEVHALTGENGSGKSTLSRIMAGIQEPDKGEVLVDGRQVRFSGPADAIAHGIVMVSQELTLATTLTVAENIFMGRLPKTRLGTIDWPQLNRKAAMELDRLGVHIAPTTLVADLSVEMRQEVEIARALSSDARVLILDEATSSLSEAATRRVLDLITRERDAGIAVVMITHRIPEIYAVAQVATVLRDGRLVATVPLPKTTEAELVRLMVGREIHDFYGKRSISRGETVLEVDGLHTLDGCLAPTSFSVARGEVLGIAGLVGSGKAEVGLALGGAIEAVGLIRVAGRIVIPGDPARAIAAGIGYVPDDRKTSALLPVRSVLENFTLAWRDRFLRFGLLNIGGERKAVNAAMKTYCVDIGSPLTMISALSGGNQQKVILGRTFERRPDVLVLSEPTRGIDLGAKSEIYRMMHSAAEAGAGVVVISSELPELLGVADAIAIFFEGRLVAVLDRAKADEETIARLAVTGPPPAAAVGAHA
jgi:ABC-type sugar transport system ATPase subunit